MYFSEKHNLLVIAIPKTGTRSVEIALLEFDPSGENHSITINGKRTSGEDLREGFIGHARAVDIMDGIGKESFRKLNTVTFIRDPYEKLVSVYFFNKQSTLWGFKQIKGHKKRLLRKAKFFMTVLIAKALPFQIWAFLYPYKSNASYVKDRNGNRIVKYIGRTELLNQDLKKIFDQIGIPVENLNVGHLNKSKHLDPVKYFENRIFQRLISLRLSEDKRLYDQITKEMNAQEQKTEV